jgi:hypothetical protein
VGWFITDGIANRSHLRTKGDREDILMIELIRYTETSELYKLTLCDNQAEGRFLDNSICVFLATLDAVYCEVPIVTEYKLRRKYTITNCYAIQSFFSEIIVFTVHTLFFQDSLSTIPIFP